MMEELLYFADADSDGFGNDNETMSLALLPLCFPEMIAMMT